MKQLLTLLFCFALAGSVYAANDFYVHGGFPATGSTGSSSGMRAELDAIMAGFDKLPGLAGNANKAVVINSGGTGATVTTGTMALTGNFSIAGNLSTTGAFNTSFTQGATTTLTLPLVNGTLATLAGTETLTTKTINLTSNTLAGTTAQFNTALSDNDFATLAGSETLTTKTINLTSNTLSGTTAQFNTALSDNDFATLAGAESLSNKTIPAPTVTGTATFTGLIDASGASAGQLSFPATQNASAGANVLDDYEEGTWTPSLGGTATYTAQIGKYTKVGNKVTVWCSLAVNLIGTGSTTTISGLPFVPDEEAHGAVKYAFASVNAISMVAYTSTSTTQVFISSLAAASANNNVSTAVFANGTVVNFTLTYKKT